MEGKGAGQTFSYIWFWKVWGGLGETVGSEKVVRKGFRKSWGKVVGKGCWGRSLGQERFGSGFRKGLGNALFLHSQRRGSLDKRESKVPGRIS